MAATPKDLEKRRQCERRRAALELERSTFLPHWRELSDFILPRRSRFYVDDNNRGDKRNQKIIDSTATESAGVLSAGMMAGVTNPSRPWFRLTIADPAIAEKPAVKAWLYEVQTTMETVFTRSNVYNKLPTLYGDGGVFGTGAVGMFEDEDQVLRMYDFPLGSFCIGTDSKGRTRIFTRVFRYTVQQTVELWGNVDPETGTADFQRGEESVLSLRVQNAWRLGGREDWVQIAHIVQPNDAYDGVKMESQYKRFESLYYEIGQTECGFLERKGFDEFPIFAFRWEQAGDDVYGTNCPGMRALGDIKQLQYMEKKVAQAIEKQLNPPLKGPSALKNQRVSTIAGDITYTNERDGQSGLQPIYEVKFDIGDAEAKAEQIRKRIKRIFKEDLFLMLTEAADREKTATEVDELSREKMLALGSVLEQANEDVLDPMIDRGFAIMNRAGLIPEPPQELQGKPITVEYISIMAQAQRAVVLQSLDRFAGAIGQAAQWIPEVLDRFNADEWVAQYADGAGVPPTLVRSLEEAQALRDARNQQAANNQGAENMQKIAGAARDLGNAPVDNNSALARLVGKSQAQGTLAAARTPVPGYQGSNQ